MFSYIKDKASSKLLYTGKIDKYQKKKYNIKVWVTDNYASKIKINELADYVGVNRSYLASSFKRATGYSPKEYLICLRMEKAKSLLEKTDMPVNAVANSVGYTDQLAFSRMFKEYAGISPKAFRDNKKIQGE